MIEYNNTSQEILQIVTATTFKQTETIFETLVLAFRVIMQ